eukprot:2228167-Rhodomonas_salina.2
MTCTLRLRRVSDFASCGSEAVSGRRSARARARLLATRPRAATRVAPSRRWPASFALCSGSVCCVPGMTVRSRRQSRGAVSSGGEKEKDVGVVCLSATRDFKEKERDGIRAVPPGERAVGRGSKLDGT